MLNHKVMMAAFVGILLSGMSVASAQTSTPIANSAPTQVSLPKVVTHAGITCELADFSLGSTSQFYDCVHPGHAQPVDRLLAALVKERLSQTISGNPPPALPTIYVFKDIRDWDAFFNVPAPSTGTVGVFGAQSSPSSPNGAQPDAVGTFVWGLDKNGGDTTLNPIAGNIAH